MAKLRGKHLSKEERLQEMKEYAKEKIKLLFMDLDELIEKHIVTDELDGVERTLVEFNYNEWIKFKKIFNK